jgi:hypothetical protein
MRTKYILTDTFNERTLSRHKTIRAAVIAKYKHLRALRRANGVNSYTTYLIDSIDGEDIRREVESEEARLYSMGGI